MLCISKYVQPIREIMTTFLIDDDIDVYELCLVRNWDNTSTVYYTNIA